MCKASGKSIMYALDCALLVQFIQFLFNLEVSEIASIPKLSVNSKNLPMFSENSYVSGSKLHLYDSLS
jgi:hypothetical protein